MGSPKKVQGTPWGVRLAPKISQLEKNNFFRKLKRMGRKYNFDYQHAAQVCRLSLALFDDLKGIHKLPGSDRKLLMAAALLHDIGAHKIKNATPVKGHEYPHHHKRSQKIILRRGVPGLNQVDAEIVANVVRYHTKGLPSNNHIHYRDLNAKKKTKVRRMAALVRIADTLDRRHVSMVQDLRSQISKDGKEIVIWVFCKKHEFDWRPKHRTDLFEKEFGMKVRIQLLFGTATS
jgi:exopolyphosphatase/guanosine-5'-triphosphate,3'-diphosphate pyrophosphatase